jgi:hypothetical protein
VHADLANEIQMSIGSKRLQQDFKTLKESFVTEVLQAGS